MTAAGPPVIPATELSDALAALGVYTQPPTRAQLRAAEAADGREAVAARLANALYGAALARVMTTETAAAAAGVAGGYRAEAWRASGATGEGTAILLHYSALRMAGELHAISRALPVDLGVMAAATAAADALAQLLEVCTVRSTLDPRAETMTARLTQAADQCDTASTRIRELFATARDATDLAAQLLNPPDPTT